MHHTSSSSPLSALSVFVETDDDEPANSELERITAALETAMTNPDNYTTIKNDVISTFIPSTFEASLLVPEDISSYTTYAGSATAPPCHQPVSWIVFDTPLTCTTAQLLSLKALVAGLDAEQLDPTEPSSVDIFGSEGGDGVYLLRPVQPVGGRVVQRSRVGQVYSISVVGGKQLALGSTGNAITIEVHRNDLSPLFLSLDLSVRLSSIQRLPPSIGLFFFWLPRTLLLVLVLMLRHPSHSSALVYTTHLLVLHTFLSGHPRRRLFQGTKLLLPFQGILSLFKHQARLFRSILRKQPTQPFHQAQIPNVSGCGRLSTGANPDVRKRQRNTRDTHAHEYLHYIPTAHTFHTHPYAYTLIHPSLELIAAETQLTVVSENSNILILEIGILSAANSSSPFSTSFQAFLPADQPLRMRISGIDCRIGSPGRTLGLTVQTTGPNQELKDIVVTPTAAGPTLYRPISTSVQTASPFAGDISSWTLTIDSLQTSLQAGNRIVLALPSSASMLPSTLSALFLYPGTAQVRRVDLVEGQEGSKQIVVTLATGTGLARSTAVSIRVSGIVNPIASTAREAPVRVYTDSGDTSEQQQPFDLDSVVYLQPSLLLGSVAAVTMTQGAVMLQQSVANTVTLQIQPATALLPGDLLVFKFPEGMSFNAPTASIVSYLSGSQLNPSGQAITFSLVSTEQATIIVRVNSTLAAIPIQTFTLNFSNIRASSQVETLSHA